METRKPRKLHKTKKAKKNNIILNQVIEIYKSYIEKFEKGEKVVFELPWEKKQVLGIPRNANTGGAYRNSNAQLLSLIQEHYGLDLPFFLNNSDLVELGLKDKQPDFPIAIGKKVLTRFVDNSRKDGDKQKWLTTKQFNALTENEQLNYEQKNVLRHFHLYHHSQFDDSLKSNRLYQKWIGRFNETQLLEKLSSCKTEKEKQQLFEPKILAAKHYLDVVRQQQTIGLISHPSQCYYHPLDDDIAMVDSEQFYGKNALLAYVGVYAHELSHATGHKSRLDRKLTGQNNSKQYGFEELVAESSSLQILKQFNLPSVLDEQSAAYIYAWLKTQHEKGGKDFLSIACSQGQLASQYISDQYDDFKNDIESTFDVTNAIRSIKFLPKNAPVSHDLAYQAALIKQKANDVLEDFVKLSGFDNTPTWWQSFSDYLKHEIGYGMEDIKQVVNRAESHRMPEQLPCTLFDISHIEIEKNNRELIIEENPDNPAINRVKKQKRSI